MDKSPDDQVLIGYAIIFGARDRIGGTWVKGEFIYASDATSADDAVGKAYQKAMKEYPVSGGHLGHWGNCQSIVHVKRSNLLDLATRGAAANLNVPGYFVVKG